MDTELDKWICEKLVIPYKPLEWDDVLYYEMVTRWSGRENELKIWPRKAKSRRHGRVVIATYRYTSNDPKYRGSNMGRFCKWSDNRLAHAGKGRNKWYYTEALPHWYAEIVKNINKHKLTLKQFRELYNKRNKKLE